MDLKLNKEQATAADNIASGIKDHGKYVGKITRAEKLLSTSGTHGLGLSFKTKDGQTADYLDIWHTKSDGTALSGLKTVNAILCCTKVADAEVGRIQCEKWNNETKRREIVAVDGYPGLMGKDIGLLLQEVLETNEKNGKDVHKLAIFAVFNAETELTASEMYAKATNPERLTKMLDSLLARPVRDNRKKTGGNCSAGRGYADMDIPDEDVPF